MLNYIYPKLLEEVDMEKKKSIKSKRIQNFSSQEVDMKKRVYSVQLEKIKLVNLVFAIKTN